MPDHDSVPEYGSLAERVECSQDLQSSALRVTRESLDELVDESHATGAPREVDPSLAQQSAHRHYRTTRGTLLAGGTLASAAFGTALLGMISSPAFAASSPDVQMLQTSASLENLAVQTYKTALTLGYVGGSSANPVIKAFATTTMGQHKEHAQAFNAAIKALGGAQQTAPDPKYLPVVEAAVKKITADSPTAGALAVVGLAITLENIAAETYVNNCSMLSGASAKRITASIMGVEAQHVATLRAVQALLMGGASSLIALSPTVVTKLPAAAGKVGFPDGFYPVSDASPAMEGAVK